MRAIRSRRSISARRRPRLGLRGRAIAGFAVTGLLVSSAAAAGTYGLATNYLTRQREEAAQRQSFVNARFVRAALRSTPTDVPAVLASLRTSSDSLLYVDGRWFGSSVQVQQEVLPPALVRAVEAGRAGRQRIDTPTGPALATGVALPAVDAGYYEIFSLDELQGTLSTLGRTLVAAAALAAIASAIVGSAAGRRVVRPLVPIATTATQIADGDLSARLDADSDRDLRPLVESFNAMAESLERRIEREARFASDVSHELRTPLAVLTAAMEVLQRRREGLPETSRLALDAMAERLESFQALVLDLLEISRLDAGAVDVNFEPVAMAPYLRELLDVSGMAAATLDVQVATVCTDRRRLTQVIVNLVQNAANYGGGVTSVVVEASGDHVEVRVDDAGPGLGPGDELAIFDRFARGRAARRAGAPPGSGLGLALVVEHARILGGTVVASNAPGGGARFTVRLPVRP